MTALTVNGSAVAATTLAAAGKLFNATGGTSGNTSTKVGSGSGTNYKQIFAKGTNTGQGNGVTSIPAPTDSNFNGWMWDVATLEGQRVAAGTWTPTIHLLASTGTTVTPTVAWYKRSSGGVYTSIGSVAGSSIALTTSSQALTFTPPSLALMDFATGDKLVMWLWVNQTAGGATNSTISVVEATSGSTAGVTSEAQAVTPGYAPIPVTLTATCAGTGALLLPGSESLYMSTVIGDTPLRYYRLDASSGTVATDLGSQGQNGTLHGSVTLSQTGLLAGDANTAELFDGSTSYITLPTTGLPTGANAWTIEAWAKLSANTIGSVVTLGTLTTDQNAQIEYIASGTNWRFTSYSATGDINGPSGVTIGGIYYLAATYDGTTVTFYVNGTSVGTHTSTLNLTYGLSYLGNGDLIFSGEIDEVAIYGVAFTSTQVASHYTAGTSPLALALATPLSTSMAGTGTLSGTLSASSGGVALSGECDGVGTLSGTLSLATTLSTTFAGAGTLTGPLSASMALASAPTGVGALTGTLSLTTSLGTTLPGVGTLDETLSANTALTDTLIGTGTLTGTAQLATSLSTTLVGVGTLDATIREQTALTTSMVGAGMLASTIMLTTSLATALSGTGTLTGAFSVQVALFLNCLGLSTLVGTMRTGAVGVPGTAVVLDQLVAFSLLGDGLVTIASIGDRERSASTMKDNILAVSTMNDQPVAHATLTDRLG